MEREDYEEKLLTKVAWYYYIEDFTQQQIGEYLGIPRLRVNRLLDKARKSGFVHFSIRDGNSKRTQAELELIQRFHLKDVFVVPSAVDDKDVNERIAQAAAMYIHDRLDESSYINMGYGDTPGRILNHLANMSESPVNVVSLTGGVRYYLPNVRSNVFNAKLHLLPTPLLMKDAAMVSAIEKEPSVQEVRKMATLAQMTILGIGSLSPKATTMTSNILNHTDFVTLTEHGAVGDMLCHFIDKNGNLVPSDLESRLITTPLEALKTLDNIIGAAGGYYKTEAILAALRGNYLDILITDEAAAYQILEIIKDEE